VSIPLMKFFMVSYSCLGRVGDMSAACMTASRESGLHLKTKVFAASQGHYRIAL
jgi:hypothetical protein